MTSRTLSSLGLSLLLAATFGCDKATPVAPAGVVLSISASPSNVTLTGASTISVVGRKPDGQALNPGTEVRFSTNIGTVDPIIATVKSGGIATTTFRGDGRSGTATITASTGTTSPTPPPASSDNSSDPTPPSTGPTNGIESVSVRIVVGEDPSNRPSLIISANPTSIAILERSTITIIGRNPDRSPVPAGQSILLTTTLGSLNPVRPVTRADGTATSIFTAGRIGGEAEITAYLGTSEAATTKVTIRDAAADIGLRAEPTRIPLTGGEVKLFANVTNGEGLPVSGAAVRFESDIGTLSAGTAFTNTSGEATVTLTVTEEELVGFKVGDRFNVTATVQSGTGTRLTETVQIEIR